MSELIRLEPGRLQTTLVRPSALSDESLTQMPLCLLQHAVKPTLLMMAS
jgi:hypothetical protein